VLSPKGGFIIRCQIYNWFLRIVVALLVGQLNFYLIDFFFKFLLIFPNTCVPRHAWPNLVKALINCGEQRGVVSPIFLKQKVCFML